MNLPALFRQTSSMHGLAETPHDLVYDDDPLEAGRERVLV